MSPLSIGSASRRVLADVRPAPKELAIDFHRFERLGS
jgi:hypothetical protein